MQSILNMSHDPKELWQEFYQITQKPRPSKKEEAVREYILSVAKNCGLEHKTDEVGNVLVIVPASSGYENKPAVIIQNHMDMVTDSVAGKKVNFSVDPIEAYVDGEWVRANGTTLGADNGIGCAAALVLMKDKTISHPKLEILFTMDEETGLKGAWGVHGNWFSGKNMLNLDTEEWGSLYIGCAGGIDYEINGEMKTKSIPSDWNKFTLNLKGFHGGHSGVDIHEQRGNAIKICFQILAQYPETFSIIESRGGRAHNIIPREVTVHLAGPSGFEKNLKTHFESKLKEIKTYLPELDQKAYVEIEPCSQNFQSMLDNSKKLFQLINLFPHGAHKYDLGTNHSTVGTSNNLAKILVVDGKLYFQTSLRFFDRNEIKEIENMLHDLGAIFNLNVEKNSEYPSWKPAPQNKLLELVKAKYQDIYKVPAKVKAIHAGLECGIIREKVGEIDVISFGPTIINAHSPAESVNIKTVEEFWKLLKAVLKEL
jgi:dipeptidase D